MKKINKYLALFLTLLMVITAIVSVSSAETPTPTKFAIFGDSIASGYGLKNINDSYASIIAAQKSYSLTNCAVPGHTTSDLLDVLTKNTTAKNALKEADLISISIGGNDLIQTLVSANTTTLLDIAINGVNAKVVSELKTKLENNINKVCKEIRLVNPNAPIILQNVYNPLYANNQYKQYASFAENFKPIMDTILANVCKNYKNVSSVDVHKVFDTYYKDNKSYDIIQADGIHPTEKGHNLIAQVILQEISRLEQAGLVEPPVKFYYLLGDSDNNKKLTISDATVIQKVLAGMLSYNDEAILALDADQNGQRNVKDATAIQKYLADFEVNPNIGTYLPYYG